MTFQFDSPFSQSSRIAQARIDVYKECLYTITVVDTYTTLNQFVGDPDASGLSVVNLPFM